jgi:hypothetical protein
MAGEADTWGWGVTATMGVPRTEEWIVISLKELRRALDKANSGCAAASVFDDVEEGRLLSEVELLDRRMVAQVLWDRETL